MCCTRCDLLSRESAQFKSEIQLTEPRCVAHNIDSTSKCIHIFLVKFIPVFRVWLEVSSPYYAVYFYPIEGRHPDAHHAMGTIAVNIVPRTLGSLHNARATLFQRHAAHLVAKNAACLMSGFDFKV